MGTRPLARRHCVGGRCAPLLPRRDDRIGKAVAVEGAAQEAGGVSALDEVGDAGEGRGLSLGDRDGEGRAWERAPGQARAGTSDQYGGGGSRPSAKASAPASHVAGTASSTGGTGAIVVCLSMPDQTDGGAVAMPMTRMAARSAV